MKKITTFILLIAMILSLFSCTRERDAKQIIENFVNSYGAEGIIYSSQAIEGEIGYISDKFIEKIYRFSGEFPENYAIFLNNRTDFSSECAAFVCRDAEMIDMVQEMCLERIRLISGGEKHGFVKRSQNLVFYSTMKDRERAEKIFSEIIR